VTLPPGQPAPASGDSSVSGLLEFVTKFATLLVVSSYAIGYMIVLINENAHGFLETSLFKPRAITAGVIFILITVMPISITQGTFFPRGSEPESRREWLTRWLLGLVDYMAASFAAALMMLLVFIDDLHSAPMKEGRAFAFLGLFYVVSVNGFVRSAAPRFYRKRPTAWVVYSILCLAVLMVGAYILRGFMIMRCLGWMFGITILVNPYLSDIKRGIKFQFKIPVLTGTLLAAISVYSIHLFPFMKATWGGGAPVSTAIYLSKDSPIHPNEKVKAALLEASDSGFYVMFDGDEKATYVPKASVTAMEFTPPSKN
jgi:hypothetical protein